MPPWQATSTPAQAEEAMPPRFIFGATNNMAAYMDFSGGALVDTSLFSISRGQFRIHGAYFLAYDGHDGGEITLA